MPPIVPVKLSMVRVKGALLDSLLVAFTNVGNRAEALTDLDRRAAHEFIHVVTQLLNACPRVALCLVIIDPPSVCLPLCRARSRLTSRRRLLELVLASELISAVVEVASRVILALVVGRVVVPVVPVVLGPVLIAGSSEPEGNMVSVMESTEKLPVPTQ